MNEFIRIRVCLAVVQGARILLVPHFYTGAGAVQWNIPGGCLRFGEKIQDAAVREFEEETGLRARADSLLDVSEVMIPERPYHSITVTYSGTIIGGELAPEPGHAYGAKVPQWLSAEDLAELRYHPQGTVEKALGLE